MADETGNFKAWIANGGKKKIGAHGTTAGASVLATIFAIQQMFGPLNGLAEIPNLKARADTVITLVAKVDSIDRQIERMDRNIEKLVSKQGMVPEPKGAPETVVVFYNDSTGRGVYTISDTAFIPRTAVSSPR